MNAEDLILVCTCYACPEQYDVFDGKTLVGYIRFRHGYFAVNPVVDGNYMFGTELMYKSVEGDDGILSDTQRDEWLSLAKEAIAKYHNEQKVEQISEDYLS